MTRPLFAVSHLLCVSVMNVLDILQDIWRGRDILLS